MRRPGRFLAAGIAVIAMLSAAAPAVAQDDPPKSVWQLKMFRFEFDNDTFLGSDDVFTAGWSFQVHSRLMDEWNDGFAGWIGRVPGLGDDGADRRVVRWAAGLSQIIVTPTDISIAAPQPDDAPWAGTLGVHMSWSAYDNRQLGALQVYLGCMGPCSQAEDIQKFIHEDLGLGEPPEGWDNQLANQALGNLNYEYRHKLYADEADAYAPGRFATDLAVGAMAAAGNLATLAQAEVEFRFGWGVPMGFTKIPDPPGVGMVLDPVYLDPALPLPSLDRWRAYFNLVGRYVWFGHLAPAEGGETVNGDTHPGAGEYPGKVQALFGLHLARVPVGLHLTYYRYLNEDDTGIRGSTDWVNFSFEYRF